jgi:CheY-like chemotaxis protein
MTVPEPLVLFVHDSADERTRAADLLAGPGRRVETLGEPAAALAALATADPSSFPVLVTDVGLKGEGGAALAKRVKDAPSGRNVSIVLVSGPEGERAAFQSGALALLNKPLDAADARSLLEGLLEDPARRAALEISLLKVRRGDGAAIGGLRDVVEDAPGSVLGSWAQYHLGVLLHARGDGQGALEEWSSLVEDSPAFWRAHVRLGAVFEASGDTATAAEHYRRALAAQPGLSSIRARADVLVPSDASAPASAPESSGPEPSAPDFPPPATAPLAEPRLSEPPRSPHEPPRSPHEPPRSPHEAPVAAGPVRTVLVADDSELALEMISEVLTKAGYRVVTAADGKQALDLARKERPDLMILDGLMPGATGFDVCKEVKEKMYPGNAPKVVILSAIYTKQRQKSEARELYKADDVLSKPFDDAEFIATVKKHLAG